MLVFESFLNVFWAIFGVQNGALGLIVDHDGLTSVLIWTPKIDEIVKTMQKSIDGKHYWKRKAEKVQHRTLANIKK